MVATLHLFRNGPKIRIHKTYSAAIKIREAHVELLDHALDYWVIPTGCVARPFESDGASTLQDLFGLAP